MTQAEKVLPLSIERPTLVSSQPQSTFMRIKAMDLHRGVIMVLMALCHCRDYIGGDYYENLDWDTSPLWQGNTYLEFFQQAFCSVIAAGGFFMLMGVGMVFLWNSRLSMGWTSERITKYLILRGSILVGLQLTLLQAFEIVTEGKILFYAGVLMSLGICMIFAAASLYLAERLNRTTFFQALRIKYTLPIFFILLITLGMQGLVHHLELFQQEPTFFQDVLFLGGEYQKSIYVDINFTPIPWFPAVAAGLVIGQLMIEMKERSFKIIGMTAGVLLTSWLALRYLNLSGLSMFGSYKILSPDQSLTFASFFSVSKYPPSIVYFLWSLGFNLGLLWFLHAIESLRGVTHLMRPIQIFGQCALFFFMVHWFVYYGWSFVLDKPGMSSTSIVLAWLVGLVTLYPMCKAYNKFKHSKSRDSLWRMF